MLCGQRKGSALCLLLLALAICSAYAQNATCPDGFTGNACALCQSDAACAASTGNAAATCSSSLAFAPNSQLKSYSCSLPPGGLLGSLLEPGSLLVQCSTGLAAGQQLPAASGRRLAQAAAPPAGPSCTIGFTVANPRVEVKCLATGCSFTAGSSSFSCSNSSCSCPASADCGGNVLISSLAAGVKGQASLDCNATGGCAMKIQGLPVQQIDATCQSAECLVPAAAATGPPPAAVLSPPPSPKPPAASPSPPPSLPPPSPPALSPPAAAPPGDNGTCPTNWGGNGCVLCKSDFACMTAQNSGRGVPEATCSKNFTYAKNSMVKSYSCELPAAGGLAGLIQPGSLVVQCHTGLKAGSELPAGDGSSGSASGSGSPAPAPEGVSPTAAPAPAPGPASSSNGSGGGGLNQSISDIINSIGGGNGQRRLRQIVQAAGSMAGSSGSSGGAGAEESFCEIRFAVKNPNVGVQCKATDCDFNPGSADVECSKTTCTCPGAEDCGSTLIKGLVSSATGQAKLSCKDDGKCAIMLEGLPISQLDAVCQAAECLVPTDKELNNTSKPAAQSELNSNPIIAAVPFMVLVLIAAFTGAYTYSQRAMWGYSISSADVAHLEALAAKPALAAALSHKVGVLEFSNLSVSVPLPPGQAAKKAEALRTKALRRSISHATMEETHSSGLARLVAAAKSKLSLPHPHGDVERAGTGQPDTDTDTSPSGEDNTAASDAAEFVVGLHQSPQQTDRWFILKGCSGRVHGGQVVGLLGPSGCGKTTLLGSIAGSAMDLGSGSVLTGSVQVDGHRRRKSHVAYVPQSDVLIPSLTVQECLRYSALLRLPQDTSALDLQIQIERVLDELGLRHIADAKVGGSGGIRGVSGGERRRVTIGMELVTDPSILVLDEPTSGLDSYTADNLMRSLKAVAATGRVVLASLHQPSRDVFSSLDQVVLMGHGRVLYMGAPADAEAWFDRHGLPCPAGTAIAEHMLRIASDAASIRHLLLALGQASPADALPVSFTPAHHTSSAETEVSEGATSSGTSRATSECAEAAAAATGGGGAADADKMDLGKSPFDTSPLGAGMLAMSQSQEAAAAAVPGAAPGMGTQASLCSSLGSVAHRPPATMSHEKSAAKEPHRRRKAPFGRQLSVMFWRTLIDIVRNPSLLLLHSVVALVMGLVTGLVFFDSDLTNVGVQNRMGGTFFALAFLAFTSLTTVDLLINERQVVTREVRGGYYHPAAYLLSKLTLDALLLRVLPAIKYFSCFYYLAGFRTGSAYAACYCFVLVTFSCVVGAMSMSVTVASNTAGQASFAMNFLLLFSLVFTGFLVNVNSIPGWIRWVHYLSIFYYAFEAMITSEVSGLVFTFQASGSASIPNVLGEVFLETLGFNPNRTTANIGILVAFYFILVALALALFFLRLPRQSTGGSGSGWQWRRWRLWPLHRGSSKQAASAAPPPAVPAPAGSETAKSAGSGAVTLKSPGPKPPQAATTASMRRQASAGRERQAPLPVVQSENGVLKLPEPAAGQAGVAGSGRRQRERLSSDKL